MKNKSKLKRTVKAVLIFIGILVCCMVVCCSQCISVIKPSGDLSSSKEQLALSADLKSHVVKMSVDFHPRSYQDRDNQEKVKQYIERHLRKNGCQVSRQSFTVDDDIYENVLALLPGKIDEKIVIGAHYDSYGDTPGADDNASGVAGLLELAAILSRYELRHTIEFVAYGNEEPPFFRTDDMGSARHARILHERGDKVRAMICLEMIGYYDERANSQSYPLSSMKIVLPTTGNFIGVVGNWESISLSKLIQRSMARNGALEVARGNLPGSLGLSMDFSDHRNYWAYGYPAVMITDTSFFRNPHYHLKTDTVDLLDYEKMADVVRSLAKAILILDQKQD